MQVMSGSISTGLATTSAGLPSGSRTMNSLPVPGPSL